MATRRKDSDDCRGARGAPSHMAALVAVLIAGCAAPPPLEPARPGTPAPIPAPAAEPAALPPPAPAAPSAAAAAAAPPAPAPSTVSPQVNAVRPPTAAAAAVRPPRADAVARYERATFASLPATTDGDWLAMWPAFLHSCQALGTQPAWKATCARTAAVDRRSAKAVRAFFAAGFDAYRIRSLEPADAKEPSVRDRGLVTGYYEPLLRGSRKASPRYRVPIYRVPPDLVAIDLAGTYPELAGLRLRGRMDDGKVVAYPTRGEIMRSNLLAGQELLWVDDAVDAFFLHVQGSGRVQLDDGRVTRLGYGDSNGHPYRSIGRWLVDQGELTIDQASMQGIKAWAARNPRRLDQLLAQNPSFVFFRELPLGDPSAGPTGALGVPLTPHASLAVDARFVPLGAPLLLASTDPASGSPYTRPMVAQDTGSAIRGPLRFDYFWGYGADAGERAGRQKHEGRAWLLVPKGAAPETLLKR